jgi:lysophospholipid acyltransferase (LPLAT)-like uncharacterized protein
MLQKIIAQFLYFFIRLMHATYRYEWIDTENKNKAIASNERGVYVYAVWHQNFIGSTFVHIGQKFTMIVSGSKDGELVATACKKMGYSPVRGSSTRGGKEAMFELVKKIKSGLPAAITVDGPKGPVHVVKPGIVEIARLAKCPVLPLSSYPVNYWSFEKSWDKFRVPKPFTKIYLVLGEPIFVDENISTDEFEQKRIDIANAINLGEEKAKFLIKIS